MEEKSETPKLMNEHSEDNEKRLLGRRRKMNFFDSGEWTEQIYVMFRWWLATNENTCNGYQTILVVINQIANTNSNL